MMYDAGLLSGTTKLSLYNIVFSLDLIIFIIVCSIRIVLRPAIAETESKNQFDDPSGQMWNRNLEPTKRNGKNNFIFENNTQKTRSNVYLLH